MRSGSLWKALTLKNKCTVCKMKGHNSQNCPGSAVGAVWKATVAEFTDDYIPHDVENVVNAVKGKFGEVEEDYKQYGAEQIESLFD